MAISAADIIDRVLLRLEENPTDPTFWSRAEVLTHLQDGVNELNFITLKVRETDSSVTLGSLAEYNIPTTEIAVLQLSINEVELKKTSIEMLDREDRYWQRKMGRPIEWAPIGLSKIMVAPRPSSGFVAQTATLVTLTVPATLTDSITSYIEFEDEFADALTDYTFHACRFKEGGPEFKNSFPMLEKYRKLAMEASDDEINHDYALPSFSLRADTGPEYEKG